MKKIIGGLVILIVGVFGFWSIASAHHLNVTGTRTCVRADGSWDWTASYTIPNEDWAQGLTVVVTWTPGSSGTTSADYVMVSASGAWSNGNSGGGSTKIYKGEKCPEQETTTSTSTTSTTSTTVQETTTTSTLPSEDSTSTTSSVVTTTSAPATTTSSPASTVGPSTSVTGPPIVQDTPTAPAAPGLPETGSTAFNIAAVALVILLLGGFLWWFAQWRKGENN